MGKGKFIKTYRKAVNGEDTWNFRSSIPFKHSYMRTANIVFSRILEKTKKKLISFFPLIQLAYICNSNLTGQNKNSQKSFALLLSLSQPFPLFSYFHTRNSSNTSTPTPRNTSTPICTASIELASICSLSRSLSHP